MRFSFTSNDIIVIFALVGTGAGGGLEIDQVPCALNDTLSPLKREKLVMHENDFVATYDIQFIKRRRDK